jgi:DNA-binding GntR family transcriptional regulator
MNNLKFITRMPVVSQAYEHIKEAILNGELLPGEHLPEVIISKQLGVSRAPIREALLQLEADGLIELRPSRGAFVRVLTAKDVIEIYSTRSLLEGYAAFLAAKRSTVKDIEQIREAFVNSLQMAEGSNIEKTINADLDIHRAIWNTSGHGIIIKVLSNLEMQIRLFMAAQAHLFENLVDSVKDHEEIIEAIATGNSDIAKSSMQEHIDRAGIMILESMDLSGNHIGTILDRVPISNPSPSGTIINAPLNMNNSK